jgi:hypothetical protein
MKERKMIFLYSFLTAACVIMMISPLVFASREQVERLIVLLLSTEILTPILILGTTLVIQNLVKHEKGGR